MMNTNVNVHIEQRKSKQPSIKLNKTAVIFEFICQHQPVSFDTLVAHFTQMSRVAVRKNLWLLRKRGLIDRSGEQCIDSAAQYTSNVPFEAVAFRKFGVRNSLSKVLPPGSHSRLIDVFDIIVAHGPITRKDIIEKLSLDHRPDGYISNLRKRSYIRLQDDGTIVALIKRGAARFTIK